MRRTWWIALLILVLVLGALAAFLLIPRFRRPTAAAPAAPASRADLDEQDVPPLPHLGLNINTQEDLEVLQGTPLLFTLSVANPRAANAQATNEGRERFLALIQDKVAKGEITAAAAQPALERARQKREIKVVRLGTGDQGWETFVHFEIQTEGSQPRPLDWPVKLVTAPPAKSLTLDAASNAHLDYALDPQAAAQVPAGDFVVAAVLDVPAGGNLPAELWRGRVRSGPVKLKILPAPAELSPEEQSKMSLEKAEFFAATGDWPNALASAQAVLVANPKVIRALIIVGEAKEAQGDLAGARDSYAAAEGQFYKQFPNSYEAPEFLILKIASLEERLKKQPAPVKH